MESLGQAHWYIKLRYCKAIVNGLLEKAGAEKKPRFHSTILPAEFVHSVEDCSKDEEKAKTLQEEYEIVFCFMCWSLAIIEALL